LGSLKSGVDYIFCIFLYFRPGLGEAEMPIVNKIATAMVCGSQCFSDDFIQDACTYVTLVLPVVFIQSCVSAGQFDTRCCFNKSLQA